MFWKLLGFVFSDIVHHTDVAGAKVGD